MNKNFSDVKDEIVCKNENPVIETFTKTVNIKNHNLAREVAKEIKKEKEGE